MKILITGGAGVIGSLHAAHVLAQGHTPVVLDACDAPRNEFNLSHLPPSVEVIRERIEHMGSRLVDLVERVDAIVHAAAHTGIPHSAIDPEDDWISNVEATRALVKAIRLHPRPTVILSSVKPLQVRADGIVDEYNPTQCDEPYAASKLAQAAIAQAWATSYDLPIVTFRCSNLYGPAACHGPRHGWATWFAIAAATGRDVEIHGTGRQSRDLLYATDLSDAIDRALARAKVLSGRVFCIGGGSRNEVSVNEAAVFLSLPTRPGALRPFDDARVVVDNRRASLLLGGWEAKTSPQEGLAQIREWAQRHRDVLQALYR